MFLLCVFVSFYILGQHECSQPDGNFNELRHAEWECDTVCVGSGGKAAFDLKNKICKCTLDKNTDDIEKQLILKQANFLGIPLVITKDLVKRQTYGDSPEESILGQMFPQRIFTPRTSLLTTRRPFQFTSSRAFGATNRFTTPRINTDIHQRLQAIQKRIDERRRSRARNRTGSHLQQRAGFADESRPNLMERLREIQKEMQEKQRNRTAASTTAALNVAALAPRSNAGTSYSSAIIGANRNASVNPSDRSTDVSKGGKNSNMELITQDPTLYSKED